MRPSGRRSVALVTGALLTLSLAQGAFASSAGSARDGAVSVMRVFGGRPQAAGTTSNLAYNGGTGGIGVETGPKVYLVLWGSQWSSDPSGEATILQNFLGGVGGSSWLASVTQYCQSIASGTASCSGVSSSQFAESAAATLGGVWFDNGSAAPSHPKQSQLANEAVKAASHFTNTAAGSNSTTQYVVATAHGNNASGFGTRYCAWHSSVSSSYGNIAYTNLPYITDAGASCGANFNNLGPNAGITIVEGHELAETVTDQYPSSGWTDSSGSENGDKCAWSSATSNQSFGSGGSYPVQPLWSNAANGGSGGCVLTYP